MSFSLEERTALLALKGVGPTVITRLEQMGIDSLAELGQASVSDILAQASNMSQALGPANTEMARRFLQEEPTAPVRLVDIEGY